MTISAYPLHWPPGFPRAKAREKGVFKTTLVEFPPGLFHDETRKCHLIYVQSAMWEPLVDARRLLSQPDVTPLTIRLRQRRPSGTAIWRPRCSKPSAQKSRCL